jgi:O-methyltransferase involved in polyketide biosynthesis
MSSSYDYEKISVTAKLTAFLRTFSDIPYSQELSEKSNAEEETVTLRVGKEEQMNYRAPQFEARYKLVTSIIEQLGIKQILEIASGLSARGLVFTRNPDVKYLETDLPGIIKEKETIVKSILSDEGDVPRPNLIFQIANAFNPQELQNALACFSADKIAIVSEGLLTYLSHEELERLSASLHEILSKRDGLWITDIPTNAFTKSLSQQGIWDTGKGSGDMEKQLNRPIKFLFETSQDVEDFFESHGFTVVEAHPYSETIDQLACIGKLNLDKEKVMKFLTLRSVFVLKAK